MQFSEHWLRTLVNPPLDTAAAVRLLTMSGLEVEELRPGCAALLGIVVAQVLSTEKHPERRQAAGLQASMSADGAAADRLRRAERRAGHEGAAARASGPKLPGGLTIKAAKDARRRQRSACCARRANSVLSRTMSGLLALPAMRPSAGCARRSWPRRHAVHLKLTPNRADCLSILGYRARGRGVDRRRCHAAGMSPRARADERTPKSCSTRRRRVAVSPVA
jgi:phenylalanyl-tRNA synthetase beta chain